MALISSTVNPVISAIGYIPCHVLKPVLQPAKLLAACPVPSVLSTFLYRSREHILDLRYTVYLLCYITNQYIIAFDIIQEPRVEMFRYAFVLLIDNLKYAAEFLRQIVESGILRQK